MAALDWISLVSLATTIVLVIINAIYIKAPVRSVRNASLKGVKPTYDFTGHYASRELSFTERVNQIHQH